MFTVDFICITSVMSIVYKKVISMIILNIICILENIILETIFTKYYIYRYVWQSQNTIA